MKSRDSAGEDVKHRAEWASLVSSFNQFQWLVTSVGSNVKRADRQYMDRCECQSFFYFYRKVYRTFCRYFINIVLCGVCYEVL